MWAAALWQEPLGRTHAAPSPAHHDPVTRLDAHRHDKGVLWRCVCWLEEAAVFPPASARSLKPSWAKPCVCPVQQGHSLVQGRTTCRSAAGTLGRQMPWAVVRPAHVPQVLQLRAACHRLVSESARGSAPLWHASVACAHRLGCTAGCSPAALTLGCAWDEQLCLSRLLSRSLTAGCLGCRALRPYAQELLTSSPQGRRPQRSACPCISVGCMQSDARQNHFQGRHARIMAVLTAPPEQDEFLDRPLSAVQVKAGRSPSSCAGPEAVPFRHQMIAGARIQLRSPVRQLRSLPDHNHLVINTPKVRLPP